MIRLAKDRKKRLEDRGEDEMEERLKMVEREMRGVRKLCACQATTQTSTDPGLLGVLVGIEAVSTTAPSPT